MINKVNIIIADDEPVMQRILSGLLHDNGYEVFSANTAETELEEFKKNHYDLLVSDNVMEGKDGIDLVKALKAIDGCQNLPVILLSGKNDTDTKVKAFKALADDYVTKPFDIDELVARINTQLRLRHLQEEIENKNQLLIQRNRGLEENLDMDRRLH